MSRLIDANELLKIYEGWIPQLILPEDTGDKRGVETCIKVLQDAPTIDAVPVIRCKECKYSAIYQYSGRMYCTNKSGYGFPNQKPDDFCSYGKSAMEDENNGNNHN